MEWWREDILFSQRQSWNQFYIERIGLLLDRDSASSCLILLYSTLHALSLYVPGFLFVSHHSTWWWPWWECDLTHTASSAVFLICHSSISVLKSVSYLSGPLSQSSVLCNSVNTLFKQCPLSPSFVNVKHDITFFSNNGYHDWYLQKCSKKVPPMQKLCHYQFINTSYYCWHRSTHYHYFDHIWNYNCCYWQLRLPK